MDSVGFLRKEREENTSESLSIGNLVVSFVSHYPNLYKDWFVSLSVKRIVKCKWFSFLSF